VHRKLSWNGGIKILGFGKRKCENWNMVTLPLEGVLGPEVPTAGKGGSGQGVEKAERNCLGVKWSRAEKELV